jgi:RES domain
LRSGSSARPVNLLPDPPPSGTFCPLLEVWSRGSRIVRAHKSDFGATELNPGYGSGRFHPLTDSRGQAVPTLYGSSCLEGALAETVFHGVPVRGRGRYLRSSVLKTYLVSVVIPRRDLRLVQLHGFGLRRLGLSRSELIDSDPSHPSTNGRFAGPRLSMRGARTSMGSFGFPGNMTPPSRWFSLETGCVERISRSPRYRFPSVRGLGSRGSSKRLSRRGLRS